MRRSAGEKMEIIRIVQDSELGVKRTLEELGISRSTFYEWYRRYLEEEMKYIMLAKQHISKLTLFYYLIV